MTRSQAPEHAPASAAVDRQLVRRAALASLVGTAVEWYDYFIFGSASALVFGTLFFPKSTPLVGTLSAFAVFGVGFVARPLGGIVFGHIGDRVGRKTALVTSLLIMGTGTALIGVLPTAGQVGVTAPILLLLLRLVQGFGVGGEWGGAALVAVEFAPPGKRGAYGSFPQVGNALGVLLSTGAFALITLLPEKSLYSWGWRVPFLASAVLIVAGLLIRLRLTETPAFARARQRAHASARERTPLVETLRGHKKPLLLAMGMRVGENVLGYIILTFAISYAARHGDNQVLLAATTVAAAIGIVTFYGFGALSDRFGRRPVFLTGAAASVLTAFPFFWLLDTGSAPLIYLAVILSYSLATGAQYGVQPAFFSELFGTTVRYTGISVGVQVTSIVAGGLAPTIATALLAAASGSPWLVSLYMIAAGLISFVAAYLAEETHQIDIEK